MDPRSGLHITYIGGPSALIEWGGFRLLTDPTFDPAGSIYHYDPVTLRKLAGPAIPAENLGRIDAVLLSHDHHFDNLDRAGRQMLAKAGKVFTTEAGAERLTGGDSGLNASVSTGHAIGLSPWRTAELTTPDGSKLLITGTPCRHGPAGGDRGPVTGFMLELSDAPERAVYVSGDTVWYEGVAEIAKRFKVDLALLFMGAAVVKEVGPSHLTMSAADAILTAGVFPNALIVPLHFEGWAHFLESRPQIETVFRASGMADRLRWPEAGVATTLSFPAKS